MAGDFLFPIAESKKEGNFLCFAEAGNLQNESRLSLSSEALSHRTSTAETYLPPLTIQNDKSCLARPTDAQAQKTEAHTEIPQPGEFNKRLAHAITHQSKVMKGTGHCAKAVQRALAHSGLPQFCGVGNAWDMLKPLENNGVFVRIPESEAAVGDLIVRPPSTVKARHSKYGDISVVTSRHGDVIKQTNDATFIYNQDNPRYDGKAVFLRYAGKHNEKPAQQAVENPTAKK